MPNPLSGSDVPETAEGLNAQYLDGATLSNSGDGTLLSTDASIPTEKKVKDYVDSEVADHSDNHTDLYYTQAQIDALIGGYDLPTYGEITDGPTGLMDEADISIAWNRSTLSLMITATGAGKYVYVRGVKHLVSQIGEEMRGDGTHFTIAQGMWYFFYDIDGTGVDCELKAQQTFPGWNYAIICYGYYDATSHTVSAHDYLSSATAAVAIHEVVKCVTGALPTGTANGEYYRRLNSDLGSTALNGIDVTDGDWEDVTSVVADVVYPNFLGGDVCYINQSTAMLPSTRRILHDASGPLYKNGLDCYNNALLNGNATGNKESRIALEAGTIIFGGEARYIANNDVPADTYEQDLGAVTDAGAETNPALIPIIYRDDTKWIMTKPQPWAFHHGGGRPYYNSIASGSGLTAVASGKFVPYYLCAVNHPTYPIVLLMGQNEYTTELAAAIDPRSLNWDYVPFFQMRFLWRLVFSVNTAHAGTHDCCLRAIHDLRGVDVQVLYDRSGFDHVALSGRDFRASGHTGFQKETVVATTAPGVNNDEVDTAAAGIAHRIGDFALESDDKELFVCMDAAAGAADWDKVILQQDIDAVVGNGAGAAPPKTMKELDTNFGYVQNIVKEKFRGLSLSNGADTAHDIVIAVGSCYDSTGAVYMEVSSPITVAIDASGAGGLDTGTVAASTQYYVWLIKKDSDGTYNGIFSLSSTAPTMPAGHTYKALLRGANTNGSADIINNQFTISNVVSDRIAWFSACDEKTNNTSGGGFTLGAWRTRDLNTVLYNEIPGVYLSGNRVKDVPAGEYIVYLFAPAYNVHSSVARIYNITGSIEVVRGSSGNYVGTSALSQNVAFVDRFSLTQKSDLEVQHYAKSTDGTWGFGYPANIGINERYTQIVLGKVG